MFYKLYGVEYGGKLNVVFENTPKELHKYVCNCHGTIVIRVGHYFLLAHM